MADLFEWFEGHYGRAFTTQYGPHILQWTSELQRFAITPAQLKRGMDECLRSGESMPPNLPTFIMRCREYAHAAHRTCKALPRPWSHPDVIAKRIAEVRAVLAGKPRGESDNG